MADNRDSFILSRNKSKARPDANPKWPDFRGEATIEGKTYELAAWILERKSDGSKFFSGSIKLKVPKAASTSDTTEAKPGNAFDDGDPAFDTPSTP